jgi:AraC family transcriptional regulator of adaptative response/methylated-DNA-[protein]-cysteine methyltransferase
VNTQEHIDFKRIEKAIKYIRENFKQQPTLDDVAREVCLSPAHFQRLFTAWAGISPKKFLQYTSIEYAKKVLKESTLLDTACKTGLSGTSRLHDLFLTIEGMTPGEYKHGGKSLSIHYSFAGTPFGDILVAATPKGICYMAFADDPALALDILQEKFPNARYRHAVDEMQQNALSIFTREWGTLDEIKLHLKGTDFQLKVWELLLKIPAGKLTTYGDIALKLNNPRASRAVGTAIGDNPVTFLIPCHRVIRSSGDLGGYHWGVARKAAIIGWEAARNTPVDQDLIQ